jgi:bifunctional non-homologous end joining protein LigD
MVLEEYKKKRNLQKSKEPSAKKGKESRRFVVQKHDASHLHYDFRLAIGGVLKSWAVPKGPSINSKHKRLAILTEDHPMSYANFEGIIPEGNYGAGTVMVWDKGSYKNLSEREMEDGFKKGALKFELKGKKLKGAFTLIKFRGDKNWLLNKAKDANASKTDVLRENRSVKSGKSMKEIGKKGTK